MNTILTDIIRRRGGRGICHGGLPRVLVLLLCLISCSGKTHESDPDTLYLHLDAEPGHLNPITSNDASATTINLRIYETLLDRDFDTLKLKPMLAAAWTVSSDHLRYRFFLKKDVVWSDGVPFTADDVVYSFGIIKDPKVADAPLKVYYIDVKNVRKIDLYTVEFEYTRPYFLGLSICGEMPIVPKHLFNDGTDFNTHKYNRHPVGTGPYIFERWDTGKKIVLVRNERFRGPKPAIRRVVYRLITEPNIALRMLKKGELDVMSLRAIQWVRQTGSDEFNRHFYKLKYNLPTYSYIGWNARRDFFKDRAVRTAMTLLVNRPAILEKLNYGLGEIVNGTFYINSAEYSRDIQPLPYDPMEAKKILYNAGWRDSDHDGILDKNGKKFSFTFTYSAGSKSAERVASILKEDMAKAGIEMNINRFEWAVFVQKLDAHEFDAVFLSWMLTYADDPYQLWHSSQIEKGSNFCAFSNPEADRIIVTAREEFRERERVGLYHRFNRIIHREQPYTFMFCSPALAVVSKRFGNVKVHARGLNYLEWTVAGDENVSR